MAEQQEQGTEQATPFKLREARKRGAVAKSMDLNSLAAISVLAAIVVFWGKSIALGQLGLSRQIIEFAGRLDFSLPSVFLWLEAIGHTTLFALLPLFFLLCALGVLANLVQTGPVFSAFPLKPDFNRVNPFEGMKRIFSLKFLFEALKGVLKMGLLGAVLYVLLSHSIAGFVAFNQLDARALFPALLHEAGRVISGLLPFVAFIALADFLYTNWDFMKRMRMSRRELRDELKQREGDPRIRARIRELRQELLKRAKSLKRVKDADVLITNPTHVAAALVYRKGQMAAPQLVAKGAGDLAARMKMVARRNGVPIVESPLLARQLFKSTELDKPVPEELYPEVARVLAWVYAMRNAVRPETLAAQEGR
jgi:flagellar biosynthetic protein FlhB